MGASLDERLAGDCLCGCAGRFARSKGKHFILLHLVFYTTRLTDCNSSSQRSCAKQREKGIIAGMMGVLMNDNRYSRWKSAIRRLRLAVMAVLFFTFMLQGRTAETVSVTYDFAGPEVAPISASHVVVSIADCEVSYVAGQPRIPFRTARIVLPPGARVAAVEAVVLAPVETIPLMNPVDYGRAPIPLGIDDPVARLHAEQTMPDPSIYGVDAPYPQRRAELLSVQRLHGFDVAIVRLNPVQYLPVSGQLLFVPEMACTVTLVDGPRVLSRGLPMVAPDRRQSVMDFVDNPELIKQEPGMVLMTQAGEASYDYLLVTAASLTNAFQPFVEHKTELGLSVKMVTVNEALAGQTGVDDAAKLRAYIRQAYDNWGITYVLLGGDVGVVPHRGVYVTAGGFAEVQMPSDVYFACLDGTWNGNTNAFWGELDDGVNGGDIDLLAEVLVGRAPVTTYDEAERFVAKTIRYALDAHTSADQALFLAEYMPNPTGGNVQGGLALDYLIPDFKEYVVTWLDDRPKETSVWLQADCVTALNESPNIVAHFGHANATRAMRMDLVDIGDLENESLFLFNSAGCNVGQFDYGMGDSFAERLLIDHAGGAFAAIANTRLGWYAANAMGMYSGEFIKAFFSNLLAFPDVDIGTAHFASKHAKIGRVVGTGHTAYRWIYLGNTLFGDPHQVLQTDALDVEPSSGFSASGYAGGPFAPLSTSYTLTNTGTGVLSWASVCTNGWVSVSPASGTVDPGTNIVVDVSFSPAAAGLDPGSYSGAVVFSNAVSGYAQGRDVHLQVDGNLSFESAVYAVMESAGAQVPLSVLRAGDTNTMATVDYMTRDGSAVAGLDYVSTTGMLHFAAGETKQTIVIDIINDAVAELDEVFFVELANPTGTASIEPPGEAQVAIRDDDWPDRFEWELIEPSQQVGAPFEVTVSALDRAGVLMPDFVEDSELYVFRGGPIGTLVPHSTNGWDYPMASYSKYARTQAIYIPEEVGGSGLLTALWLGVAGLPSVPLDDWTIRMKETSLQHYDSSNRQWETNDWVVVFHTDVSFTKRDWHRFEFTQPFVYSGTNNLLVDYSFSNDSVSGMNRSGICLAADVETNRCFFAKNNMGFGDPLHWSGRSPAGKIDVLIPGAIFERRQFLWSAPRRTGPFVGGVWTGDVDVRESGTNLYLAAYSIYGQRGESTAFDVAWPGLSDWLAGYELPIDGSVDDCDTDGDGFTNREEWLAGTDPTNALSRLSIESVSAADADGSFRLRWQSVPGKRYRVERAERLGGTSVFEVIRSNILGTSRSTEAVDLEATAEKGFYRVGVEE